MSSRPRRARAKKPVDPCSASAGDEWVYAHHPLEESSDELVVGKWLIYVRCPHVSDCWHLVRESVEAGTLGPAAKVSTDWAMAQTGADSHVICVYTSDFRNKEDVLRVARQLAEIGAVKSQVLSYKPDIFTHESIYASGAGLGPTIYTTKKPYSEVFVKEPAFDFAVKLVQRLR